MGYGGLAPHFVAADTCLYLLLGLLCLCCRWKQILYEPALHSPGYSPHLRPKFSSLDPMGLPENVEGGGLYEVL